MSDDKKPVIGHYATHVGNFTPPDGFRLPSDGTLNLGEIIIKKSELESLRAENEKLKADLQIAVEALKSLSPDSFKMVKDRQQMELELAARLGRANMALAKIGGKK
jgi:hypothetical protein